VRTYYQYYSYYLTTIHTDRKPYNFNDDDEVFDMKDDDDDDDCFNKSINSDSVIANDIIVVYGIIS